MRRVCHAAAARARPLRPPVRSARIERGRLEIEVDVAGGAERGGRRVVPAVLSVFYGFDPSGEREGAAERV